VPLSSTDYSVIVEQSPLLIWRADLSMGCDFFNDQWLRFTGRTLEQEMGNGWAEGVHPDDMARCLDIYTRSFAARQTFEMEYRLRRHDGAFRWLFDRGVPFFTGGVFAGYIGSCIDVTGRVEAERALLEAHEQEKRELRALIPVCCSCKNIRDDHGYWEKVEVYLRRLTRVELTHTLCPPCLQQLYPEVAQGD
jgi:PAS domain S-box-containing protein